MRNRRKRGLSLRFFDSGPITQTRGDHDSPLHSEALWNKFEDCLAIANTRASAKKLFDALMKLDDIDDVRTLMRLMA